MTTPALVIMAAGMGSRFGGLKQLIPVDDGGHPIIDFSLYDARRAGFQRVVFLIKHAIDAPFRDAVGRRAEALFQVDYVYQEPDALPPGFTAPAERAKPWGTGHAVACCREALGDAPFAVINADDFYGAGAFRAVYDFLAADPPAGSHAMLGYRLRNTVTENGGVSRGICSVADGMLTSVTERTDIRKRGDAAVYVENGVEHPLTGDETVSMNFWGFARGFAGTLWELFPGFLTEALASDALKREFYLPGAVGDLLRDGRCTVRVLPCDEVWHGVTYREDLQSVRDAIAALKQNGVYPESLWERER